MTAPAKAGSTAVTVTEKNISDSVLSRVHELEAAGDIHFPPNYSFQNALKSAWLVLQETIDRDKKPALTVCTRESVANALLNMVIQGLSPAKKQCYFIVYGNKLQLSRSYFGTVAVLKRLKTVEDVYAEIIYEKDEFEYEIDFKTGRKIITKHKQSFENIDITKIKGAYAVVVMKNGDQYLEVMNIAQIRAAWNQGQAKGKSGAHENFTDQMCKKTVVSRACKMFVNTSDDSDLLIDAINNGDFELPEHSEQIRQRVVAESGGETLSISGSQHDAVDIPFEEVVDEAQPETTGEDDEQFVIPFK